MKTRLPSQILEQEGWTTRYNARDADDNDCPPTSERAKSFCALGAITRYQYESGDYLGRNLIETRLRELVGYGYGFDSIAEYNDHPGRTKDQVIRDLKTAEGELIAEGNWEPQKERLDNV